MENGTPAYVDREELLGILTDQSASLSARESAWWQAHRVDPFPARLGNSWHYVVAREVGEGLVFFGDEDEFGVGKLGPEGISEEALLGDLIDAVRYFLKPG